jgi:raffinose/stachyose/melibiose transport system permease protein
MFYNVSRRVLLAIYAIAIIVPSSIVVLGTFKSDFEIYTKPLALPKHWSLANFSRLFHEGNVLTPFRNSLIVTCFSVFFTLMFASMCAFAISRMITVTGRILFALFALGLAIPGQVNIIPIYLLFVKLHLTNSLFGLVLVNIAVTMPISIFILTTFFRDLPREMVEASGIDGAGSWRIYRSIALPLSKPAMGATAIFLFVIDWNDLLYPLMLITQSDKKTLPLTLIDFRGEYATSYSMLFTAIMVASIPMVLMYIFMQKSFVAGLTAGAVKG